MFSASSAAGDRALALSKLRSAAVQLGLPYEVLEQIALAPSLARLPSNKERRFHVYQSVAQALGVVSRGVPAGWRPRSAPPTLDPTSMHPQGGRGNRADLDADLEEAVRLLYPNPSGAGYVGFKPAN